MPFDTTQDLQLASVRPLYTQVKFMPGVYPYRAFSGGNYVAYQGHTTFLDGTPYLTGDLQYLPGWLIGADHPGHVMWDYEPKTAWSITGTCSVTSGVVEADGTPFLAALNHGFRSRFKVNNIWYDVLSRTDDNTITLRNNTVNASAGSAFEIRQVYYRDTDPSMSNKAAVAYTFGELAYAMGYYSQRIYESGSKPGLYGELLTHQYTRTLDIISDANGPAFKQWLRDLQWTAKLKVWNGLSIPEMLNSWGGAVYFPAYIPTTAFFTTNNQKRWRLAVRRMNQALRQAGCDIVVPLLYPYDVQTAASPVPAELTQGIIADANAIKSGEWGVWAGPGVINSTFYNTLPMS